MGEFGLAIGVVVRALDIQRAAAREQAISVAEKIRTHLAEPYVLRSAPAAPAVVHECSASIGVALFCGHDESRDRLMERADQAMYQAKEAGRNRVTLAREASK